MKGQSGFYFLFFTILSLAGFAQHEILHNYIQDPEIKTVQFYVYRENGGADRLQPAVKNLNSSEKLVLEFDDLRASYRQYHVRIIHADYDWTQSTLTELQYLSGFNDQIINTYDVSQNTKIPYYHYAFLLPEVKMSGNYVIQLFENYIEGEPIMQLRYRIYDPQVNVLANAIRPTDPSMWRTHQQLEMELNYGKYPVRNPMADFKLFVRQNFDDEKSKEGFQPSSVNQSKSQLLYRFFKNENLFPAGNEFRFFDIRSTYTRGNYVSSNRSGNTDVVQINEQFSRANKAYLNASDLNSRYVIENLEGFPAETGSDYVNVQIQLKTLELAPETDLYVYGALTNYQFSPENKCQYQPDKEAYACQLLLKQGVYDYSFVTLDAFNREPDFSFFEGNFSDTGNSYEIFVYHKPPSARAYLLVGYFLLGNSR